jgi:hypothetical protein
MQMGSTVSPKHLLRASIMCNHDIIKITVLRLPPEEAKVSAIECLMSTIRFSDEFILNMPVDPIDQSPLRGSGDVFYIWPNFSYRPRRTGNAGR